MSAITDAVRRFSFNSRINGVGPEGGIVHKKYTQTGAATWGMNRDPVRPVSLTLVRSAFMSVDDVNKLTRVLRFWPQLL